MKPRHFKKLAISFLAIEILIAAILVGVSVTPASANVKTTNFTAADHKNFRMDASWVLTDSLKPDVDTTNRIRFKYGGSSYMPVVGDWNGDGVDTPGVFQPSTGNWVLTNSLKPDIDTTNRIRFRYGGSSYVPVAGDWNGNGSDNPGVFQPSTGNWVLTNSLKPDVDRNNRIRFKYGGSSYMPVVGNWDGYPGDNPGVFQPSTGNWVLTNSLKPDIDTTNRIRFKYGNKNYLPVAGNWDGHAGDNPGVVTRADTSTAAQPTSAPKIRLSNGGAAPSGNWYRVALSGYPANSNVTLKCHDSIDPSGFHTKTVRVNGSGAATLNLCYSGDGPEHWVTSGSTSSNRIRWGTTSQSPVNQPTLAERYENTIVKQSQSPNDPTSWLVRNGKRYWIPDGGIYECLLETGSSGPAALTNAQLDALPDQIGQHSSCGGGTKPPEVRTPYSRIHGRFLTAAENRPRVTPIAKCAYEFMYVPTSAFPDGLQTAAAMSLVSGDIRCGLKKAELTMVPVVWDAAKLVGINKCVQVALNPAGFILPDESDLLPEPIPSLIDAYDAAQATIAVDKCTSEENWKNYVVVLPL